MLGEERAAERNKTEECVEGSMFRTPQICVTVQIFLEDVYRSGLTYSSGEGTCPICMRSWVCPLASHLHIHTCTTHTM